jgi:hypothetical protein
MEPSPGTVTESEGVTTLRAISEHIVSTKDTCGGDPRIVGSRIRVKDVVIFHLDEDTDPAIAAGLRRHGIDVATSQETRLLGEFDTVPLSPAHAEGRVLFTHWELLEPDEMRNRVEFIQGRLPSRLLTGLDSADLHLKPRPSVAPHPVGRRGRHAWACHFADRGAHRRAKIAC